jgi:UDP-N-acetyl-2-amino-2-deoxyglucuronate dehydrogenase
MGTTNKKIRFAIIGCGRISKIHVSVLSQLANAILVAVCDIVEEKAKEYAQKFNCAYYIDYKELLKSNEIDVVNVCTPTYLHAQMVVDAAMAGKHVVTEKPIALTLFDADRMIKVCKKQKVTLFVVKQNRYNPPITKLKEAIEEGRFGKIFYCKTTVFWQRDQKYYDEHTWFRTRNMGGGVLINQASHNIDMLCWLMGPVESVFAKVNTFTHRAETEDFGLGMVRFKSGALGVIEATTCVYPKNLEGSVTVFGENGSVKVGGIQMNDMQLWEFRDSRNEDEIYSRCSTIPPNVYGYGHIKFFEDVLRVLEGEKIAYVDGNEGKPSLELILAMYESSKQGKEVVISEFLRNQR